MESRQRAPGGFAIPSLDGIRCVAVLIVFVGHGVTVGGPWPGDVGVTIFFFLSGFLITTLLRREHSSTGQIALGRFYLRRALRILPPAYIVIAASVVIGGLGLLPSNQNGWGVLAEVLNYTNYYMVASADGGGDAHTGLPPESSMLWSLAVEEHFYLVFPAVMIVLLRRRLSYRVIGFLLAIACLIAPFWRVILALGEADFYRLYISTDTRFDGLLAGAALALIANPALGDRAPVALRGRSLSVLASVATVTFVLVAIAPSSFGLTVGDTVIYVCLVPIFWYLITRPDGWAGRCLNSGSVVHIGVLSFSIYLVHKLVIAFVSELQVLAPFIDLLALCGTLVIAELMYRMVEKPLGRFRKRLESRSKSEVAVPTSSVSKSPPRWTKLRLEGGKSEAPSRSRWLGK